jgi:hypothetical protein
MLMAGTSPNLSAAKRFQATMRANNPGIVPDKQGTARTLDAARKWQQSMRLRDPGIVGNATSPLSQALVESAQPKQLTARAQPAQITARAQPAQIASRVQPAQIASRVQPAQIAARAQPAQITASSQPLQIASRVADGGKAIVEAGTKALTTGGGKAVAGTGTTALATRAGGELVKQGGKAVVDTAIKQIPGQLARGAGNAIAMNAAKAVLPVAVVAAAQKATGEFPELEKLRLEEAATRRFKMKQGMQTGMGNSEQKGYMTPSGGGKHETHMTGLKGEYKPIEDMTGYAVDLIRKGKGFDEARRLMQGTEKFRGMSDAMKEMTLAHYDTWRKGQLSAVNPEGRKKLNAYLASEKKARMDAQAEKDWLSGKTPSQDITGLRKPLQKALGMAKPAVRVAAGSAAAR